jgi:RNA polymerase sigma factor (sigma-70 family)
MTAPRSLAASLQDLARRLSAADAAGIADAELVRRFAEQRDEGAFTALVQRYGTVVLGVCRRVLRHEQDAEDAFQATFLVLARNAGSLQRATAVGNWLYGVAGNVARKAKAMRQRREVKERQVAAQQELETPAEVPDDLREVLDAELHALPAKYRAPIVLCDLMGLTTQAAAAEVGCPAKTLGTRLSRGRALLAGRLTRRGVAITGGALTVALSRCATAAVPARLLGPTVRAAVQFTTSPSTVSPAVAALTKGVSNVMLLKSPKFILLLACGVLVLAGLTRHASHPAHARRAPAGQATAAGAPAQPGEARQPGFLDHLHRFLVHLHAVVLFGPTTFETDAKEEKSKAKPSGDWVQKEGEVKIEFADDQMKIYPHGANKAIVIVCECAVEKGRVKATVTGLEGKKEVTEKVKKLVPVGLAFSFKWTAKAKKATLGDVKGKDVDTLKSRIQGEYEQKE